MVRLRPGPFSLALVLSLGAVLVYAHGPGGGGPSGGGSGDGRGNRPHRTPRGAGGADPGRRTPAGERARNIGHSHRGLSQGASGAAVQRANSLPPQGQDQFFIALESYLLRGVPITSDNDLQYIQNHMGGPDGPYAAPDGALQKAAGGKRLGATAQDAGGGTELAGPGQGAAPWEVGVSKKLIDADLDMSSNDRYALRVGGIQDSFNADYRAGFSQLGKAIGAGMRDPTALAFGALAAFHRNDMKAAAKWAKASLDKAPKGPWAEMSDSVLHLTKKNVAHASAPPKPKPLSMPQSGGEQPGGAVGPALFPQKTGGEAGGKEAAETLRAAQRALAVRDYPLAEELARKVLFDDPRNPEALKVSVSASLRMGRYAPAYEDAGLGLADQPADAELLRAHGVAAGRTGRYEAALSDALTMLRTDAHSSAGLRLRAFAEAGLGDRAAMRQALERAAASDAAGAELLRRASALPEGADPMALFSDSLLLDDEAAPAPATAGAPPPLEGAVSGRVLGLGFLALLGPLAGLWALKSLRGGGAGLPRRTSLDLSGLMRKSGLTPAARAVTLPAHVGPYQVLEPVGHGGMGVIYKAKDTGLDRLVALKKMREEIAADPRERKRFLKEANIVSGLEHPGIVRIYAVHESPEGDYLVFEFVDGKTLAQHLSERGRLPFREALGLLAQAAEAVAYAHGRGIVHRDLKPSNIMLDVKGRVRVMDFGVARASKDAITRLTAQGATTGTPAYMAPEQEDGKASPASDIYALGVCLYELLTGRAPYEGTGLALYQAKRAGAPPPLASVLGPDAPAALDEVLAKALDADPSKRYASARELAAALAVPK
ncbi:MAG: protein kinase [Elusimicrobia bacterium]|nr:protein kinase [Elusimicrobiota bacterium]